MTDKKISALTTATTPLAGTEVLPLVQSGATVKVASDDLTVKNFRAAGTTGIMRLSGPLIGTTWTMTAPNENWTAARTDTGQTFSGSQIFSGSVNQSTFTGVVTTATTVATLPSNASGQWLAVAHDLNGVGTIWNISLITANGSGVNYVSKISASGDFSVTGFTVSGSSLNLTSDGGGSNARVSILQLR